MSRLAMAPRKGLFRRHAYRQARKLYDRDLEPIGVVAHHRWILAGMGAFEMALQRSHRVEERLKVLAETKAALMVGCEFCIDIGAYLGARAGVTEEQLLAIPRHREATCFSDEERLVLDLAEAMTATPVGVSDELFAALRERFDEAQLVELASTIAWENWRARFNWTFDIGAAGFAEGMACPAPVAAAASAA